MELGVLFCMAVLGTFYFLRKREEKMKALICKAAATSLPLFLLFSNGEKGAHMTGAQACAFWCTALGIVFYMAADILLECRFVWGAVCFAAGHVSMAAGFVLGGGTVLRYTEQGLAADGTAAACTAVFLAIFIGAAYAALHRYFPHLRKKNMFVPAVCYITVLSAMAALAVTEGVLNGGAQGWIPAAGGVCFVVSDILLGQNRFGTRRSRRKGAAVLILYYLSVYLFSMRLWR